MIDPILFLTKLFAYGIATFVIFLVLQPLYYRLATEFKIQQEIRKESSDGRKATIFRKLHKKKAGTPTGGGIVIWGSVLVVILLSRFLSLTGIIDQSLLQRTEVYLPLFSLVFMGLLGAVDDFWNARGVGKKAGMEAAPKMFFLLLFALLGSLWFYFKLEYTAITVPGVGVFDFANLTLPWLENAVNIGWVVIPIYIFIIVATANAVNITDGLDGLSGGLLIISFTALGALSFLRGHEFLSIFCGIIVAALFAFLWFNVPPAKFFMGDTGSLSLGATLGVISMMIDSLMILPLIGFIFLVETISVIIQLTSKKFRNGKKVFLVAPIHHHFEAKGWAEPQIVMRFWIIGAAMAILGFILGVIELPTFS